MNGRVVFKLQIVDENERIVTFPGGGQMEIDLINEISQALSGKLSLLTTRAKAQAAVAEAVSEVVYSLKKETLKVL